MPASQTKSPARDPAEAAAAEWFIRRDRGLSETEQSDFAAWLQADPRHATALARVEKLWQVLDPVFAGGPPGEVPDADLLAPPRRGRAGWWIPLVAAAAAAVVIALWWQPRESEVRPAAVAAQSGAILHPGPERMTLPDGSVVELAQHARVEVDFTSGERRVRLLHGTAFFTVAKNPARPFVVSTETVNVRAVGTAFSVAVDPLEISVLVTEGRVRVQELPGADGQATEPRELSALGASEQGVVRRGEGNQLEISVERLSPEQIERALWWEGPRLEFTDLPLSEVVTAFNRHSPRKLVVGDRATGATRVGGNFRIDRLDGFLRALETGFNISAYAHGDELVLRQKPAR